MFTTTELTVGTIQLATVNCQIKEQNIEICEVGEVQFARKPRGESNLHVSI